MKNAAGDHGPATSAQQNANQNAAPMFWKLQQTAPACPPTHDNTERGRPRTASIAPLCVIIITQPATNMPQLAPERAETAFSAST